MPKRMLLAGWGASAIFLAGTIAAQEVPPERTTVWSGKLVLSRTYEVPRGFALRIEPGTVIEMEGHWDSKIVVKGTLEAVGTKEKPIEFRTPHYWGGIVFVDGEAHGRIEHCRIENGRPACIQCDGASPVIRNNEILTTQYGQGWILCDKGAQPVIEGNTIGGSSVGVLCGDSAPQIRGNAFRKCAVVIHLFAFGPDSKRPVIEENRAEACRLLLFDEDSGSGDMLVKVFESQPILLPRKLSVEQDGKQESVVVFSVNEAKVEITRHKLTIRGGEPTLESGKPEAGELKLEPWEPPPDFVARDGKTCHVMVVTSAGGLLGREGCMDTKPSFVLLVSGEGKDGKVAWCSPKFLDGQVRATVADLDGDGLKELIIATGRWCAGKGQVFLFHQAPPRPPGEPPKPSEKKTATVSGTITDQVAVAGADVAGTTFRNVEEAHGVQGDDTVDAINIEWQGGKIRVHAINVRTLDLLDAIIKAGGLVVQQPEGFRSSLHTYASLVTEDFVSPGRALEKTCDRTGIQWSRSKDGTYELAKGWAFIWEKETPEAFLVRQKSNIEAVVPGEGAVTTGHVIFHGHYVAPPYKFEVTDRKPWQCTMKVNGLVVGTSGFVPIPFREPIKLPPSGVFKSRDDALTYFFQNYIQWEKQLGRNAALEKARRFFLGLPYNCSKVDFLGNGTQIVVYHRDDNGKPDSELIDVPNEKVLKELDPEMYTKGAMAVIQGWMTDLREGRLLIMPSDGGELLVDKDRAGAVLSELVKVVDSDAPLLKKDRAVLDVLMGFEQPDVNHVRALSWEILANFGLTGEQKQRLLDQGKEMGGGTKGGGHEK